MLLYDSGVSGNCYKVRQLFAHLAIEYERRDVDVIDRSGRLELLGALNPALRVPTIVFDGQAIAAAADLVSKPVSTASSTSSWRSRRSRSST